MTKYKVTLFFEGSNIKTVAKKAKEFFGSDADTQVQKVLVEHSRADRLAGVENEVDDARTNVEELRDEMQEWHDSIPENLQDGDKASEVQEAIDGLEQIISDLENVDFSSVSFPGMF